MFDIESHVAKAERGANYEVDLGDGNVFQLQVRKANMRDPQYFKAQEFLVSVGTSDTNAKELRDSMEDGVSTLPPERVEELTQKIGEKFDSEKFSDSMAHVSDYVLDALVVGWTGIEKAGTGEALAYDKKMLARLLDAEPTLIFGVFGFSLTTSNFEDSDVVGDAEKN